MKAPTYFDHNSRRTDDVPLEVVEWQAISPPIDWPPSDGIEVEVRELTQAEWEQFRRVLEGLK